MNDSSRFCLEYAMIVLLIIKLQIINRDRD